MTRLRIVRFWLPLVVTAVGTVIMVAGFARGDEDWAEGGALIVSAGLSVWLLNFLYRVSVEGDRERDAEDEAREFFARHGRWPDDDAPAPPPSPAPPHARRDQTRPRRRS